MNKWYHEQPFQAFWEQGYSNKEVSTMGLPSFEVAEITTHLKPGSKVLDLGCGEGRNSLFLASLGHKVTAVDRSHAGIEKLLHFAHQNSLHIQGIVSDLRDFIWQDSYHLIMAHGVLYYLPRPDWQTLLAKAKKHTKPGGINIFTLFIYNEEYPVTDEIESAGYLGSFAEGEIGQFYEDWQQIRYEHYVKWDSHPGIPMHYHPIEKLVTRKPGGSESITLPKRQTSTTSMPHTAFMEIFLGTHKDEILQKFGTPASTESQTSAGISYDLQCYNLSLWHYGRYVLYISNDEVIGKAMHYNH